jgi:thiol-disulfide isomerase/thioredoxin
MRHIKHSRTIFCLLLQILISSNTIAGSKKTYHNSITKITVHVTDKKFLNQKLIMVLKEDEINLNVGAKKYEAIGDKNGMYKFIIPKLHNPSRFSLSFSKHSIVSNQIVEPEDDFLVEYKGNYEKKPSVNSILSFSGKGHAKLDALNKIENSNPSNIKNLINKTPFNSEYINIILSQSDSIWHFKKRILDQYKNKINPTVFQIIQTDIYSASYAPSFLFLIQQFKDPTKRDTIRALYPKMKLIDVPGDTKIKLKSAVYVQVFLLSKLKATALINSKDGKTTTRDTFKEILAFDNYSLREKLLICYFLRLNSAVSTKKSDSTLTFEEIYSSLNCIKNPTYKKLITDIIESRRKGTEAYTFNLPDTTGKMVSLKDFRNKVVIIDCWFTGCTSCTMVAKIIDNEVLPKFVNDTNVVFISVNVDRNKDLWKKGIKSGKYTNAKSINLFTEGLELDHPFIKNYHFQGFPHVMLIDKNGKIFLAEMPRNGNKMVELINMALRENQNSI